jgi:Na+/melibiose symporter-like transporter
MLMVSVGILSGAVLAPALIGEFGGGRPGYRAMAWIMGMASLVLALGPLSILIRSGGVRSNASMSVPFWSALRILVFRRLLGAYLLIAAETGATSAAVPYWVVHLLGHPDSDVGTVLGLLVATNTVHIPLWP